MEDFVHLHVHTQYSLLDGMASVPRLVDKAIANGMRGMAITDHGNMMGVKELFNYTKKKNGAVKDEIKGLQKQLKELQGAETPDEAAISEVQAKLADAERRIFKPIFGCEMYVAERSLHDKTKELDSRRYHLIVLAKNEVGYHNLIKLVSESWVDGFYNRPRTDHESLAKRHEGLIVCSACIAGEVPAHLLNENMARAEETIQWYKNVFGEDYYIELQRHEVRNPNQRANRETFPLQQRANAKLIELARKYDIKLVCTNDVHFVDEDDAEAHDRLLCLGTSRDLDDPNRMLYSKQEWFKTREEMNAIFADIPEALRNTAEILDRVETYSIDHGPIMPNFDIPTSFGTEEEYHQRFTDQQLYDEFTHDENGNEVCTPEEADKKVRALGGVEKLYRLKLEADYLAHLAFKGAEQIYGTPVPDEVAERMKFELHVMKTMGFPGYFLIVQDYINAARHELGVAVGPGRGSAAGSEVAYCLGITKVDPIKYDLLFERFLNPDRISLPDIDVDFDDDGRGKVLSWVTQKYGEEKVSHIITYGTMATKLAIKDVARVHKIPLPTVDEWCKAIPDRLPDAPGGKARKMNLTNVLECVDVLKAAEQSENPIVADTIKYARKLEGNVRNTGVHACGVIICRDDVSDWVPVSTAEDKETGEKLLCTQYEGSVIEDTGLIKMDFLGLKNLSIIKECVANIKDSLGIDIDMDQVPITDAASYKLYCDGRTIGTFQFESAGMQKYLRELQPTVFEDLIAMNALYRPGPMDYIPDFIDRKQGRKPVTYDIPCMEKYLKDTYGITVYQEQVMLLSRQLANFTRGESDTLRKAMGKKMKDKLDHMKPQFISQGQANGHDPKILEKIWADWEKFASYAFNKSHATCYSWVAFQTAYLKANFPSQYMAACMSRSLSDIKEITKLMTECKAMGIECLPPDVNISRRKFSVDDEGNIRFGLAAIKGVGESAVEHILAERDENGPFTSIFDFVKRVSISAVKRSGMECLALSGAFDCFAPEIRREQFKAKTPKGDEFLDILTRFGNDYQRMMEESKNSLFGDLEMVDVPNPIIPQAEEWSALERLDKERELVGIYLSAHPLDEYRVILEHVCTTHMNEVEQAKTKPGMITYGGIVVDYRSGKTKRGTDYCVAKVEDYSGIGEIALFGEDYPKYNSYLEVGTSLFVRARIQPSKYDDTRLQHFIQDISLLDTVKDTLVTNITLDVRPDQIDTEFVEKLRQMATDKPGNVELRFRFLATDGRVIATRSTALRVTATYELVCLLQEYGDVSVG